MGDRADEQGCDPEELRAGYEAMREAVVSGHPEGWRFGSGVLVGRGMANWMGAWAALAPASCAGTTAPQLSDPPAPSPTAHPSVSALSSLRNAGEIVAVIAQMALAHT